jgi:hypothetical protein
VSCGKVDEIDMWDIDMEAEVSLYGFLKCCERLEKRELFLAQRDLVWMPGSHLRCYR